MTTLDDDERLRQIERMIERGEVFGKPTKPKKVKAQEPKARKPRETYDHITDDMILSVFEHTKTWAQMERAKDGAVCFEKKSTCNRYP